MAANAPVRAASTPSRFVGRLSVEPTHGPVGTPMILSGKELPAHTRLTLVWETYDADWSIEQRDGVDWEKFYGVELWDRVETLGEVETDGDGCFQTTLTVPEDYGGMHDIYAVDPAGRRLNKLGFRVDVSAELTPEAGPLGTPIQLTVYGLNVGHPFEGWYQLFYDNRYVGNITAVTTRGTAEIEIPATGHNGPHLLEVKGAPYGQPFIQHGVSPYSHVKQPQLTFEITDGVPVMPPPAREQLQPERRANRPSEAQNSPLLWTDFAEVPARSALRFYGENLPANANLELRWLDVGGDRVTEVEPGTFGTGFSEIPRTLATVTTDHDGRFETTVVPESVQGGAHPVQAWHGDECLAQTYVTLGRRPFPIQPKAGPVGTQIHAEMEGVGWTEHENEVAACYDNAYIGYTCGADLMGKISPEIYATGAPGYHYVEFYPTFRNPPDSVEGDAKPIYFRRPILTWRDHPHGFHVRHVFHVENAGEE